MCYVKHTLKSFILYINYNWQLQNTKVTTLFFWKKMQKIFRIFKPLIFILWNRYPIQSLTTYNHLKLARGSEILNFQQIVRGAATKNVLMARPLRGGGGGKGLAIKGGRGGGKASFAIKEKISCLELFFILLPFKNRNYFALDN